MTDEQKLYDAAADGPDAVRRLMEREGWGRAQQQSLRDTVRSRVVEEMNAATKTATADHELDVSSFADRLDALTQAIGR